ncbi:uncharacterized protein LOC120885411 [Ictidomys tridecemlineatus]
MDPTILLARGVAPGLRRPAQNEIIQSLEQTELSWSSELRQCTNGVRSGRALIQCGLLWGCPGRTLSTNERLASPRLFPIELRFLELRCEGSNIPGVTWSGPQLPPTTVVENDGGE